MSRIHDQQQRVNINKWKRQQRTFLGKTQWEGCTARTNNVKL